MTLINKHNRTLDDYQIIDNCLQHHFFLRILNRSARNEIIKEMSLYSIDKDKTLFNQNENGNFFYIIKEGKYQ